MKPVKVYLRTGDTLDHLEDYSLVPNEDWEIRMSQEAGIGAIFLAYVLVMIVLALIGFWALGVGLGALATGALLLSGGMLGSYVLYWYWS